MRRAPLIILILATILVSCLIYWRVYYGKVDKSGAIKRVLAPIFLKFGLTDDRLVNKTIEENHLGNVRYTSVFMEYDAPKSFVWRNFDTALRAALKNTVFTVFDAEQTFGKYTESYNVIINYGRLDILTLKINRMGKAVAPPIEKVHKRPKVAIVVDDFGYSKKNMDVFLGLKHPITLSILPEQRFTREVAVMAKARGFEVILHLPLESDREDVVEEVDTIRTGMGEKEILLRLKKEISSVPGIDGVSNHMGSKATADRAVMTSIIKYLKLRGLYYFDSLTSSKSVCVAVAKSLGVRTAKRDMFLDNSNNSAAIEKQLADLKALAFRRGEAIAICHDRKNTAAVLAREMPKMASEGIEFVRLSDMVKR